MPSATKDRKTRRVNDDKKAVKGAAGRGTQRPRSAGRPAKLEETPRDKAPKKAKAEERAAKKAAQKAAKKPAGAAKPPRFTAATADRYELYQLAVNSPEADVDFLFKAYAELRNGKRPRHLREDFCGTANLAAEWLRRGADLTAEGVDLDPEPIEWGKRVNFAGIDDAEQRMQFQVADVRSKPKVKPDITTAPNFSYWCMRTREELKAYFRAAYQGLAADGLFVIDVYGGPEAIIEMEEERDIDGRFTYVWDQREYFPGTGEYHTAIHFRFKDDTELHEAFTYVWRFWHLTELKDLLAEVGFKSVTTWFEGTDPEDEEAGDGNFERDEKGENCQAWIGYIIGAK